MLRRSQLKRQRKSIDIIKDKRRITKSQTHQSGKGQKTKDPIIIEIDFEPSNNIHIPQQNSPENQTVIYPEGAPDAVCLSLKDLALLNPDQYLNDAIVDFYLKYINNTLRADDTKRFHFFNTFFYSKLEPYFHKNEQLPDDVHKWTRKIDLFAKDFLVFPIHKRFHWTLAIVCFPRKLFESSNLPPAPKDVNPTILYFDSLEGKGKKVANILRHYLFREWCLRYPQSDPLDPSTFTHKILPLKNVQVPIQTNKTDCGVYSLHYIEKFCLLTPEERLTELMKHNSFGKKWFCKEEIKCKRERIENLVKELAREQSIHWDVLSQE